MMYLNSLETFNLKRRTTLPKRNQLPFVFVVVVIIVVYCSSILDQIFYVIYLAVCI